jgi:uncharacterized protein
MADAGTRAAGTSRLEMVDALRGYALMGLFLVHMAEYFELYWASPKPTLTTEIVFGLFMGKTFSLLALCFGFSFFVMMESGRRRGQPFAGRFAWRLALLFLIGTIHGIVYRGDIIVVLALMGFLLIPFDNVRSPRLLLAVAALCMAQPYLWFWAFAAHAGAPWAQHSILPEDDPAMQVYLTGSMLDVVKANLWDGQVNKWAFFVNTGRCLQVLGLFLVGLVLGRSGFFADPARFGRGRALALAAGVAALIALYFLRAATDGQPLPWVQTVDAILRGWQALAAMAVSVLLFVLAWQVGLSNILRLLVPAGRMTLTLYVAQSLLFVPFFYGFGLGEYATIGQGRSVALGIASFAAMVAFAALWFRYFHYGPLEWLWRCGTRTTFKIPFRRRGQLSPAFT